jgi:Ca-activated chloride channel homolog
MLSLILFITLQWHIHITPSITSTTVEGKVTDANTGETIIGAIIKVYKVDSLVTHTVTDFDGKYQIGPILPGIYHIEAEYVGFTTLRHENIVIKAGKTNRVDFKMTSDSTLLQEVAVVAYKAPGISYDITTQESTVTAKRIKALPTKSLTAISATSAGITTNDDISIRGSRSNETIYFMDGVRVTGDAIPRSATDPSQLKTNTESYATINENKFESVQDQPLSTFSLDVDKAAYANVRRFINLGQKPPVDAVRIEEMINYFGYNYPAPKNDDILAVHTTYTTCPWNDEFKLLHVGVQSKKINIAEMPDANIVFLIDVSGSMDDENKLPLVKSSFALLLNQLRPTDRVAIVTYAGAAAVALPSTPVAQKDVILRSLESLGAGGSTAGAQGILTAYEIAEKNRIKNGNNRVVLATDGDFNVGVSDNDSLEKLIEEKRKSGVFLSVLGYGMDNYKDDKMQILADKGNGNHAYIDNIQEAHKVLVQEFGGTMYTLAKDVKFQLEFNPQHIAHYRLVGYENRMLESKDFNDDTIDGGELGMGHQMTAIYEILPTGNNYKNLNNVDELKYQDVNKNNTYNDEIATIKFRYKDPNENVSKRWDQTISTKEINFVKTDNDVMFSTAVAYAGILLRNGATAKDKDMQAVIRLAEKSKGKDNDGYRAEFVRLMQSFTQIQSSKLEAQIEE